MRISNVLKYVITLSVFLTTGCYHSVDINFNRVPNPGVYIPFQTEGVWQAYGCNAPLQARRFVRPTINSSLPTEPADFPYPVAANTGYGGVLQVCDLQGTPRAYDLSCPIECQRDITVTVDYGTNLAKCPKCGSTYDIFVLEGNSALAGAPVSGPAMVSGYGLRRYNVVFGVDGRYALITN